MKQVSYFLVLVLLISLLSACNKKHKYKYVEHTPKSYIDLLGKDKIREHKEKIFYAESDSAAYVKAYEMYSLSLNMYMYADLGYENIEFELYKDDRAIQHTVSFANKEDIERKLLLKYASKEDSVFKTLDAQTLKELDAIKQKITNPPGYHLVNAFGRTCPDTSKFFPLKCGLYINKSGVLALKSEDRSDFQPIDIYLTTVYNADMTDSLYGGLKEMRYVVDTTTFTILSWFYFKDKHHVYDFNPMMDGGTIAVNRDIDVKTFKVLPGDYYGKDKRHCFYRGNIVEGADIKSFKVLKVGTHSIAYDKHDYYEGGEKMRKKDIAEQHLDSIRLATVRKE